jgi:hypothetical protein
MATHPPAWPQNHSPAHRFSVEFRQRQPVPRAHTRMPCFLGSALDSVIAPARPKHTAMRSPSPLPHNPAGAMPPLLVPSPSVGMHSPSPPAHTLRRIARGSGLRVYSRLIRQADGSPFRNGREAMLSRPGWCDLTSDVDFTQVCPRNSGPRANFGLACPRSEQG